MTWTDFLTINYFTWLEVLQTEISSFLASQKSYPKTDIFLSISSKYVVGASLRSLLGRFIDKKPTGRSNLC